jgi:DNA mismatch repair ATPase MutS
MGDMLSTYAALLDHIRTLPAASAEAEAVFGKAARLGDDSIAALRRLSYLISQLDVRYNPFVIILEIGGLWSLHWLRKLDQWRAEHRAELPAWLAVLAETDTLVSWATLRYNCPEWTDPEFTDQPIVEATGLGHPLLPANGRVTNDFSLGTDGHIHLITGSNMAGKSTWLRTVGINLILANAGSSVCARHLRLRPNLEVWTSMRTQDDLSESTSSFYAELKRLKAIIEAVSDPGQQVFFLLDEILKGTNSRDRHTGSRALIRQLIRERGAGIIATHDLELAALESEPGSRVENYAMEVQTDGDQLTFDYKLHPGVCQSFNATALMARMGIDIPEDEIRLRHD